MPSRCLSPFLALLFLALPRLAVAQPRLVVETDVVNVGEVLFQHPKTIHFRLRNAGDKPLTVTEAHPSCGCTQVTLPAQSIPPGTTDTLSVLFDAQLLGTFQKEVALWTDAADTPVYLTLQGRVVSTASDYDGDFPIDLGAVRLSTNNIEFDDVNIGDHPEAVLQIVNTGRGSYKPELMHLPPYLSARYQPEQLAGGRVGRIILTLNSELLKTHGLTQTTVYLARHMGDQVSAENEIDVSALILPSFSQLTAEQMRTAPRLQMAENSVDFSTLTKQKQVMTKTLIVRNTGGRPLNVSRVQVYGKALTVTLSNRVIPPGRQAKLKVTLDTRRMKAAKAQPRVLLITDDPQRPKTILNVKM